MPEIGRLRRVGHKGADLIAPRNTFASNDAAVATGVDMIEFDVLRVEDGEGLILAHDWVDAASREPHTLARLRGLEALGVTGAITNDPRLFAPLVT
jgi:glycerophosphoryl diester phosphodiesterase